MKVMVLVKASKDSEAGVFPSEELMREMGKYNEELVKAGVMLAGEGLHPSSKGARVRFSGSARTVIDGPFTETKELLAGFWLWQVNSLQEAIDWAKKCPNPQPGEVETELEIRQVFATEDFAPSDPTGELRAAEHKLRAESNAKKLSPPRFETMSKKTVAGLNARYTMETRSEIPKLWEKFVPQMRNFSGKVNQLSYGVAWNFKDDCEFDYLCGIEFQEGMSLPSDWTTIDLPGQRYAVFTHKGYVAQIPETIDAIWTAWMPQSGLTPSKGPCFERYDESFDSATGMGGTEIWVPVEGL